jgi:hypothetical protein
VTLHFRRCRDQTKQFFEDNSSAKSVGITQQRRKREDLVQLHRILYSVQRFQMEIRQNVATTSTAVAATTIWHEMKVDQVSGVQASN